MVARFQSVVSGRNKTQLLEKEGRENSIILIKSAWVAQVMQLFYYHYLG
jgi:tryptophan synthase beta subunit